MNLAVARRVGRFLNSIRAKDSRRAVFFIPYSLIAVRALVVATALIAASAAITAQPVLALDAPHRVSRIRIEGAIDPATLAYLKSGIEQAQMRGADGLPAQALIVELDTPGGLISSVREMAQAIDESKVPVVVFITPAGASATSAGALLTLASHFAAMTPGTNIGAAHPVDGQGKDIKGAMGEKVVNDTAAFARALAEARHRPVELAASTVDKSRSFTAQEALEKELIQLHAYTVGELLDKLDGRVITLHSDTDRSTGSASQNSGSATSLANLDVKVVMRTQGAVIQAIEMTLGQKLLHLLANPNVATLLMSLGMMLIYVEVANPGITIAGALGVISLLVAFMSYQMLPIYMGGMALLLLGLVLFIAEIFVTSGGALALGGTVSFILGVIWVIDQDSLQMAVSPWVWAPVGFFLLLTAGFMSWLLKRTKTQILQAREDMAGGGEAGLHGYVGTVQADGTALFRGELWKIEPSQNAGEHYDPSDCGTEPGKAARIPQPGDLVKVLRLKGLVAVVQLKKGKD